MTSNFTQKLRFSSIILLATGYGWSGGHFYPANSPWWAYFFQYFILVVLLVLSLGFFAEKQTPQKRKVYFLSLSIVTALTFAINSINLLHGIHNTTNFGSHNTLSDIIPIVFLLLGSSLWLITGVTL